MKSTWPIHSSSASDTMQQPTSPYRYPHLADNSIRVLHLMPSADQNAPIRCKMTHCPLPDVPGQNGSSLFEALSYTWGSGATVRSVFVVEQNDWGFGSVFKLDITVSLHEALVRLRDPCFERLIWADAICINQGDRDETERQVRIMERVYASASRVLVWLGNDDAGSTGINALERLRMVAAGAEPTSEDSLTLSRLLERPWFTRMWVLQEVTAARHILMIYGSSTIDGQAFCLGLEPLLPLVEDQSLQWLARSTAQLMQGAALRPRPALRHHRSESPGIRPLGELIDMFHDRKATKAHDKIYALLGMCTDNVLDQFGPDYSVSWSELFRRLILYLLGNNITVVKTWEATSSTDFAVVEVTARLMGEVVSVGEPAAPPEGTRLVTVGPLRGPYGCGNTSKQWIFRSSSDFVRKGDFVCAVEGRPASMIVRYHNADYFSIISIMGPAADSM
ncbi:heterokaryon incompatibility protein-domain-containing protein, partial [Cercophora newfieldiana]